MGQAEFQHRQHEKQQVSTVKKDDVRKSKNQILYYASLIISASGLLLC